MDFYPTLANLAGAALPDDRIIDGKDIGPLLSGQESASSEHEAFFYYKRNSIEAVRAGRWKLHVRKDDAALCELYDLDTDVGETQDVHAAHPEVVRELQMLIDTCARDIGDEARGIAGENTRPIGRVDRPDTLTHYDPEDPYMVALYDLKERG